MTKEISNIVGYCNGYPDLGQTEPELEVVIKLRYKLGLFGSFFFFYTPGDFICYEATRYFYSFEMMACIRSMIVSASLHDL